MFTVDVCEDSVLVSEASIRSVKEDDARMRRCVDMNFVHFFRSRTHPDPANKSARVLVDMKRNEFRARGAAALPLVAPLAAMETAAANTMVDVCG